MSIVHDPNHNPSSEGATYEHSYVAPSELVGLGRSNTINIPRLWRSDPKTLIPMNFYLHSLQLFKPTITNNFDLHSSVTHSAMRPVDQPSSPCAPETSKPTAQPVSITTRS
jgi:hypothetical protein